MQKSEFQEGWDFAVDILGADSAARMSKTYIENVKLKIKELEYSINNHSYRGQDIAHFQGYIQEVWHAGTFNVNATAAGSKDVATILSSNEKWSVDISLKSGSNYSAKSFSTGDKSGIAQASLDNNTRLAGYNNQRRLVPMDQLRDAKDATRRRMHKNILARPEVAAAYKETNEMLTDRLKGYDGIESNIATRKDLEKMAKKGKQQKYNAEEFGVNINNTVKPKYVLKQALKAGYTTAVITLAMDLAPEIYKTIDYLIKTGEIDVNQINKMGIKSISSSAEGFLRGSISSALLMMLERGDLGNQFKNIDPTYLGTVVAIVLQTVKNSILVAFGNMSAKQMGTAFADSVIISGGYIVGTKIAGFISQSLLWQLPALGYMLGTLVGTAFSVMYNVGKKKMISFCVDSGFACFGLVEQNYEIPENILNEMGVHTIPIPRTKISRTQVSKVETAIQINTSKFETIDISVLRRGVLEINKIGYVLG